MTNITAFLTANTPGYYVTIDIMGLRGPVPAYDTLLVQRNNADGSITTIRNGNNVSTGGVDEFIVIDYEAPLSTAVGYTITAIRHDGGGGTTTETVSASVSNGGKIFTDAFEEPSTTVVGWTAAANTTLQALGTNVHTGTKAASIRPVTSGVAGMSLDALQPATAGVDTQVVGYVYVDALSVGHVTGVSWQLDWKNAGGATLGTDSNTGHGTGLTPVAAGWQVMKCSGVPPVGTTQVKITISHTATAGGSGTNTLFVDDVFLWPKPSIPTGGATATVTAPPDTVLVKSLTTPSLSMELSLSAMDSPQYPVRQQINPIIGGKYPVVISDVQGARTGTLTFRTDTLADRRSLLLLLESGGTLLFQANSDPLAGDGFEDMYFKCGSFSEGRPQSKSKGPIRLWTVPYTEVASPSGVLTAIPGNSWLLVTSFGTWQSLLDSRTTWLETLNRAYGS